MKSRALRTVLGALVCLLASSASASKEPRLRFAWPVPTRVVVHETSTKKGQTARVRYEVVVSRDPKSANLHVQLQNFAFLKIDGIDLDDPKLKKELAQARALAEAIPTLVVAPSGRFVDVTGYREMVEKVVATLPGLDPRMKELLLSPSMVAMMKEKSVEFWRLWVAFWVDVPVLPGGSASVRMTVPLPDGTKAEVPATVRHLGPDASNAKLVVLSMESTLAGDAPLAAMRRFAKQSASEDSHGHGSVNDEMLEAVTKRSKMRLVTDPSTMRPRVAESESTTELKVKGQPPQTQLEKHVYEFDWR